MLTNCPYPDCKHAFELEGSSESRSFRSYGEFRPQNGTCPVCKRPGTFRCHSVLKHVEKVWQSYSAMLLQSTDQLDEAQLQKNYARLPLIAALEDIRSLHNVGSIFRTADGAGFNHLILTGITGCPPRKQIAKTSLGAEETISWEYRPGFLDVLPELKKSGTQIIGLERTEQSLALNQVIAEARIRAPICLVVGNEVTGISQEVLANCDYVCHLPMRGIKESLNVSVAFGIAGYLLADCLKPATEISHKPCMIK